MIYRSTAFSDHLCRAENVALERIVVHIGHSVELDLLLAADSASVELERSHDERANMSGLWGLTSLSR